ncbi:Glycosyl hydrolases family 38 C-terminal domain-containing protein [Cryobacterium luteum]|nr:Glycosyl hydrolases family 38 C-terminal domain-containing protein [Cryobacterium luteum]
MGHHGCCSGGAEGPRAALENAWRTVLLHQFHDILPGSSITWVHQEAEREYARVAPTLDGWVLTNRHVRVTIDPDGVFSSIYDRHANREVVPIGARANLLTLHRDTPTQGDAWDLDTPARPNVRGSH